MNIYIKTTSISDSWVCEGTQMTVKLMVPDSFSGEAYGLNSRRDCKFTQSPSDMPGYVVLESTIDFDNTTCSAKKNMDYPSVCSLLFVGSYIFGFNEYVYAQYFVNHDWLI